MQFKQSNANSPEEITAAMEETADFLMTIKNAMQQQIERAQH